MLADCIIMGLAGAAANCEWARFSAGPKVAPDRFAEARQFLISAPLGQPAQLCSRPAGRPLGPATNLPPPPPRPSILRPVRTASPGRWGGRASQEADETRLSPKTRGHKLMINSRCARARPLAPARPSTSVGPTFCPFGLAAGANGAQVTRTDHSKRRPPAPPTRHNSFVFRADGGGGALPAPSSKQPEEFLELNKRARFCAAGQLFWPPPPSSSLHANARPAIGRNEIDSYLGLARKSAGGDGGAARRAE